MQVTIATKKDIKQLVALINRAYRGEISKMGWTTEADLLAGERRTDEVSILSLMRGTEAIFLKYCNEGGPVQGCVFLQKQGNKLYLGMLSVDPLSQAKGIGKQLLLAADHFGRSHQASAIFMSVISVRTELIAWYERHGYKSTGQTKPFPTDNKLGIPTQPLEFIIMEKSL